MLRLSMNVAAKAFVATPTPDPDPGPDPEPEPIPPYDAEAIILATRGTNRLWFDFEAGVTVGSGKITSIVDRIAGLTAPARVGQEPPYGTIKSYRGMRAAAFPTGNERIVLTNAIAAAFGARGTYTVMAVLLDTSVSSATQCGAALCDTSSTQNHLGLVTTSTFGLDSAFRRNSGTITNTTGTAPGTALAKIRTHQYDGTNERAWIDGVQSIAPTARTESVPVNCLSIGGVVRSSTDAFGWLGHAWTYFITDAVLTTGEIATLQEAMERRYIKAPPGSIAVLFSGQSNSEARDLSSLPATPADTAARLKKFDGVSIVPLISNTNGTGCTHYVSFCDRLARSATYASTPEIAAIPGPPHGGRTIAEFSKGNPTGFYADTLARLIAAKRAGYAIPYFVWYQGESDADGSGVGANWTTFYAATLQMFTDLKTDAGLPNLKVIVVRLHDYMGGEFAHAQVRADQILLATNNPSWITYVQSLGGMLDLLHIDGPAQVDLGIRAADAALAM